MSLDEKLVLFSKFVGQTPGFFGVGFGGAETLSALNKSISRS